jgi:D-aminopeptidase
MLPHQLTRLAQRASIGLAQVGAHGTARNHSGDIFLAVSTANKLPSHSRTGANANESSPFEQYKDLRAGMARRVVETNMLEVMKNECVDAVFRAASEAVEEAVLNSMAASAGMQGRKTVRGEWIEALPGERVRELLERYLVVV